MPRVRARSLVEPRFSCVVSAPGEAGLPPLTSRHPPEASERDRDKERNTERERERTPAPLRVCWRWRRCRILASVARRSIDVQPPSAHLLTFSAPFPILSLSDLASRSLSFLSTDVPRDPPPCSFSPPQTCFSRPSIHGFLSGTFASPTSVTRDCRDSEDIDAASGGTATSDAALPTARPTR